MPLERTWFRILLFSKKNASPKANCSLIVTHTLLLNQSLFWLSIKIINSQKIYVLKRVLKISLKRLRKKSDNNDKQHSHSGR